MNVPDPIGIGLVGFGLFGIFLMTMERVDVGKNASGEALHSLSWLISVIGWWIIVL